MNIIKILIEHGVDVHIWEEYPLFIGVINKNIDIVKSCVERGADVNARNCGALKYAIHYSNMEIVEYLIDNDAIFSHHNETNLNIAAEHGLNKMVVKILILHPIINKSKALQYASLDGHINTVKLLISYGASAFNLPSTIFPTLRSRNFTEIIELLMENGAISI